METRVQKYQKLREQIAAMDDSSSAESPFALDNLNTRENKSITSTTTSSLSLDDILKAHDEYTDATISDEEKEEKNRRQEMIEKKSRRNNIVLFSVFGVLVIAFLVLLIVLIIN